MTLEKRYESVCKEYIDKFTKKQGLQFDGWVGNTVGGIAAFSDQYYFNFGDIVYDINAKCKKWLILEWQDVSIENTEKAINYYSFSKGLRHKDLK